MWGRCIVGHIWLVDYHRVDGVCGGAHTGDGVEVGRIAVHRLEVRVVCFLHLDGVVDRGAVCSGELEMQFIFRLYVTHGYHETVHFGVLVDKHRVGSRSPLEGDGQCACKGGYISGQFVFRVDGVVERALDGGAAACK